MGRRCLLFFFCVIVASLFVPLSSATSTLKVIESKTAFIPDSRHALVKSIEENKSYKQENQRNESLTPPTQSPPHIATSGNIYPANQTNDQLVRGGLLYLLRKKDRYGVWYLASAMMQPGSPAIHSIH